MRSNLARELADIKKHVRIVNEEVGTLGLQVATMGTDLKWVKYFVGLSLVLAMSSLGLKILNFP